MTNKVFAYVHKTKQLKDIWKYVCYTPTKQTASPDEFREKDKELLKECQIDELPILLRISAYNKHKIPGNFGLVYISRLDDDYHAVGHFTNYYNVFMIRDKLVASTEYIKELDKYHLYYLGARYHSEDGKFTIVRMYIPVESPSTKKQYHIEVINRLQELLPEKHFKELKETLKLHIDDNGNIEMTFFHEFNKHLVTANFDFYNRRANTCFNMSKVGKDPVGTILLLWLKTKKYLERKCEESGLVEISPHQLR